MTNLHVLTSALPTGPGSELAPKLTPHPGELDLRERRLTRAVFDSEAITPSDAFLLLWLVLVSQNHPQIHAMASWGINHVTGTDELRRLGVTSIYVRRPLWIWFPPAPCSLLPIAHPKVA